MTKLNSAESQTGVTHRGGTFLDPFASPRGVALSLTDGQTIAVGQGQTYIFNSTFAAGNVLNIYGDSATSYNYGLAANNAYGVNDGTIHIYGGTAKVPPVSGKNRAHTGGVLAVGGTFVNNGLITIAGGPGGISTSAVGGAVNVIGVLTNNGTIDITGGTFLHGNGGSGGLALNYGSLIDNHGMIDIAGAAGAVGGRLQASGTLLNSGTIVAHGGALVGGGPAGGETGPSAVIDLGIGTFVNSGVLSLLGGQSTVAGAGLGVGAYLFQNHIPSITNTGLFLLGGGYAGASYGGTGTVTGGKFIEYGVIVNNGSIEVDAGAAATGSAALAAGGNFYNSHGTLINNGSITVQGTQARPGITTAAISAGRLSNDGVLVNRGMLTFQGGTSTAGSATGGFGGFTNVYGQKNVYGSGHLNNYGTIVASGGYMQIGATKAATGGTITIAGGMLQNMGYIQLGAGHASDAGATPTFGLGSSLQINTGSVINNGTINALATAGSRISGAKIIDKAKLTNKGVINLAAAGTATTGMAALTITSGGLLTNLGTVTGGGTITNLGTIDSGLNGGNVGVLSVSTLVNNGSVTVQSRNSSLISANVGASAGAQGTFTIGQNSNLTFTGSVASSEQVTFAATGGTLDLGNASTFAGILAGIQSSDVIDFLNQSVTSATSTGTSLDVGFSNGSTIHLTLAAPLSSSLKLLTMSDGHGGTDLIFH